MGLGASASRPLASLFGPDGEAQSQARRGPTLGSSLLPGPEGPGTWRLIIAAPCRVQIFDAHTAKLVALEDAEAARAVQEHMPFTAYAATDVESDASGPLYLAVGCQDGTVLVFYMNKGTICGPLPLALQADSVERSQSDGQTGAEEDRSTTRSITVLRLEGSDLYAGTSGRCYCWDLRTAELRRDFHLPGAGAAEATPTTMVLVRPQPSAGGAGAARSGEQEAGDAHLWVGLDNGNIAIFDVQSGVLARSFSCAGPEAVVALAQFPADGIVFALSAHRRVSVWDARTCSCLQKYAAELMTCGSDLCSMVSVHWKNPDMPLLMLAGVDGSLCARRVSRRADGKLNCVLLCYMDSISGDMGCPITSIDYHAETDSVLVGDAGCNVTLLGKLREQIGAAATTGIAAEPTRRGEDDGSVPPARTWQSGTGAAPSPTSGVPGVPPTGARAAAPPTPDGSPREASRGRRAAEREEPGESAEGDRGGGSDNSGDDSGFPVFSG